MTIVISAAIALSLLAYLVFALKPQIINIAVVRGKLYRMAADLKAAKADIAKMGAMRGAVDAYEKKMTEHEKALPGEDNIPALLESISGMAKNANMRIAGIVPIAVKDSTNANRVYGEIPINITAKAGYHELGRFISSIENSDRFMRIIDIQINGDKSSPRMHNVDLILAAYVLPEGK